MKRLLKSLLCAVKGLFRAVYEERHMRIHVTALYVVIAFSVMYGLEPMHWVAVSLACGLVLTAELLNTALERAVDLASEEVHPLAAYAKDAAAAAVLISALTSVCVAVGVFWSAEKWKAVWDLLTVGYGWLWFAVPAVPALLFIFRVGKRKG